MDRNAQQVKQIRVFVVFQLVVASVFSVLIGLMLGGTSADPPPWWIVAGLYVVLAAAILNVERSWIRIPPLDPERTGADAVADSLAAYQRHLARAFLVIQIPLLLSALYAFVSDHGGWPVLLVALPTVVALAFETWPSVRNVARVATALEAGGGSSGLPEAFGS